MELKDEILKEYEKGNVVVASHDGIKAMPLKDFIKQPAAGILYDLNRGEVVVLTFLPDPKWVNDFAVAKVITALKAENKEMEEMLKEAILLPKGVVPHSYSDYKHSNK